jgi:hypothetical protein
MQFTRFDKVEWTVFIPGLTNEDGSPFTFTHEGVVTEVDADSGWVEVRAYDDDHTYVFGAHPHATRALVELRSATPQAEKPNEQCLCHTSRQCLTSTGCDECRVYGDESCGLPVDPEEV